MAARDAAIFSASKLCSPLSVRESNTALLLMDYQNLTVGMVDDGPRTVQVASQMRDWALGKGISVFHCLIDTKSGAKPSPTMKIADRWHMYEGKLKEMPQLGDEPIEISPSAASELEKTFTRTAGHVSVLFSTSIRDAFKAKQVQSIILCGLSTSGCVLSTVRSASDEGFLVTVVEDACADRVPNLHEMLIEHVLPMTAHVATSKEIREAWG